MKLDKELKERVKQAIIDRFDEGVVKDVRLESIEILENEEEIRLVFTIETDADPELIGRRFFGLTDKVRTALGDEWDDYFPILQSEIRHGAAA
ncbi:hypothetical protein [Roseovarius sp. TE539]|uniref:hypothetical protein n=1 Tax=Roseovarius sp. TE539 TaxID=2249812 RepID=UPI0011BE4F1D|nr:hypothetical protein [Roseovarius sp. TE539]